MKSKDSGKIMSSGIRFSRRLSARRNGGHDAIEIQEREPCRNFSEIAIQPTKEKSSELSCETKEQISEYSNETIQINEPHNINQKLSPQMHFETMLQVRGHSVAQLETLKSAYWNEPTPLQLASYGPYLQEITKKGDVEVMDCVLTAGLSPNPCNRYGESIIHQICRLGKYEMLQMMLDHGSRLQVSDASGRTPLHETCCSKRPSFAVAELLLEQDHNMLFLVDCNGYTPLSYVPKSQWDRWINFLDEKVDYFWPHHSTQTMNSIAASPPNSLPVLDPPHALSIVVAREVALGKLDPEDALTVVTDPILK